MDRWQALYNFWSSFGIPAYREGTVPDRKDISFPYITYEAAVGPFGALIPLTASIWDEGYSSEYVDKKADEIGRYIKNMGAPTIDGGRFHAYIDDGTFASDMDDPDNDRIRRKVLNVVFEFLTED